VWPQRHKRNQNRACWREAVASRLGDSCDFNRRFDLICLNHLQHRHEKGHAWQSTVTKTGASGLFGYAMSHAAAQKGKLRLKKWLVSILAHLLSSGCVDDSSSTELHLPELGL